MGSNPTGGTGKDGIVVPVRYASPMYGRAVRARAIARHAEGASIAAIHRELGPSRWSIHNWILDPSGALAERSGDRCFVCAGQPCENSEAYAYLLGQYLGDGYLVTTVRIPRLRVACADSYPIIADEVDTAMSTLSGNSAGSVRSIGCSDHYCY